MLTQAKHEIPGLLDEQIQQTKERIFQNIVECIEVEGFPTEANVNFKEANVTDFVLLIMLPMLAAFRRGTTHILYLQREREIIAKDTKTGGLQEFVGVDFVGVGQRKFVFVVEAKKSSAGKAKRQCLLALKDIGDNNDGGIVYGFVTTAEQWQVIRYDGTTFTQSDRFPVMFPGMGHEKERWMKEGAVIVDFIHMVLRSGGFTAKKVKMEETKGRGG